MDVQKKGLAKAQLQAMATRLAALARRKRRNECEAAEKVKAAAASAENDALLAEHYAEPAQRRLRRRRPRPQARPRARARARRTRRRRRGRSIGGRCRGSPHRRARGGGAAWPRRGLRWWRGRWRRRREALKIEVMCKMTTPIHVGQTVSTLDNIVSTLYYFR